MIQISRSGVRNAATDAEFDSLRAAFAARHLVRLPEFFDADLGRLIERRLARAAFRPRVADGLEIEQTLDDGDLLAVCLVVLNDPAVLTTMERITGCRPLTSFTGRIYRRGEPAKAGEQYYEWHDDLSEDRRVAVSVNLGRAPYRGGALQLREASTRAPLAEASGVRYLEALLIRIDQSLEHRVAPVEGPVPRTVLAGWFRSAGHAVYTSHTAS